jgi:DNA helicase-2/ATP-dependent DNA helicase PcrA
VQHPFGGRAYSVLYQFGSLYTAWLALRERATVGELLDAILEQTRYRAYLDDGTEEGEERWANVMELRGVAGAATGAGMDETMSLGDFLQQVSLVAETDNLDADAQATTLLTLHAAKGLEFPIVFITGLEEGLLPHSRSMDSEDELAEERRLFYVGLTRARDAIYLSHAFRRTSWGDSSVAVPSRFLADIPEEYVDGQRPGNRRRESIDRASMWNPSAISWDKPTRSPSGRDYDRRSPSYTDRSGASGPRRPPPNAGFDEPRAARNASTRFKTGQKVRHGKFGEGTVIESKVTGGDEEVTVAFPGVGIKRLAASIAGLEPVG